MEQGIETETLAAQPVGRAVRVCRFALPSDVRQRLLELGMTVGTICRVVRYAPLGDPIQIKVRGYSLALRRVEAAGVLVEAEG